MPLGCTTTLSFDDPGTYTFFVETTGEIGEIDGDCVTDEPDLRRRRRRRATGRRSRSSTRTAARSTSTASTGRRTTGPAARASRVRTAEIDDAGDYELTATTTSDEDEVVVRVGRDPASGVTAMRAGSIVALVLGVVVGLAAARRRAPPSGAGARSRRAAPQWPTGPVPGRRRHWPRRRPTRPCHRPYTPRPPSHGRTSPRRRRRRPAHQRIPDHRVTGPAAVIRCRRRRHRAEAGQRRRMTVTTLP